MVAGATMVLVAPLAAVPLFLSSVGTASVAVQAAERCPRDTGASYTVLLAPSEAAAPAGDPIGPLRGALGPVTLWSATENLVRLSGPDPRDDTQAVVLARDGAGDHIEVLAGTPGAGPGAWLTDRAAEATGLGPGDVATIDWPRRRSTTTGAPTPTSCSRGPRAPTARCRRRSCSSTARRSPAWRPTPGPRRSPSPGRRRSGTG